MSVSFIRKQMLCRFKLCQTFKTNGNDTHLWGECHICGKRVGDVSREAVRRYMDAQERWERSLTVPTPTNLNRSEER